jgi:hypothetical protein
MTRFLHWRKMTWAILLWSGAMLTWLAGTEPGVALGALLWFLGFVVLSLIWFMSRPLWRQGHGARFRRLRAPGYVHGT